ncbi:hypothetical protein NEOLEDRAFT_1075592, partial [Neolentinus lepideus HHB14362 ss-1]
MTRPGGALEWARQHNSRFEVAKFGLIHFSRAPPRPSLELNGIVIQPKVSHKFLGVMLDQELRWKAQTDYALDKGAQWTYQLRRLAKTKYGLSPKGVRQLYQSVAVRKVAYAADIWYTPICRVTTCKNKRGSVRVARRFATIQRAATTCITGGLRSTATDVLDAHANLWP